MDNTFNPSDLDLSPGAIIAGRYEIQCRIGSGGMGVVFRAIDRELSDDMIALKLLHPYLASDETVFRRFRNEVLVARSLTHPNIVRTHDMGRAEKGYSYISMEYIDGLSLKDKLRPEGHDGEIGVPCKFEEACYILYAILAGVGYAHGKGVVHRDLKPANVLLSTSGEVKLADFGTARIVGMDTSITRAGQIVGTPDYMAPEQIRGERLDTSCDIYSLGMIAYELVVGKRPFYADTPVAIAFKHLTEPIPDFASPQSKIPKWYEELVRKSAAKNRKERYASVSEIALVLLEHLPHLGQQPGLFPVDGTQFYGSQPRPVTGSGSQVAVSSDEDSSKTVFEGNEGSYNAATKSATKADKTKGSFELGSSNATGQAADRWKLSSDGSQELPAPSSEAAVRAKVEQGRRGASRRSSAPVWGVLIPGLLVLLLLALVRFHQGTNHYVAQVLGVRSGQEVGTLGTLLGIVPRLEETPEARDALREELMGFVEDVKRDPALDDSELQLAANSGAGVGGTPEGVERPVFDLNPKPTPEPSAPAATATPKPVPTPEPQPTAIVPPSAPASGSLRFRKNGAPLTSDMIAVSALSDIGWEGAIQNAGDLASPQDRAKLQKEVRVNIFNLKSERVVSQSAAFESKAADGEFRVSGRLREFSNASPEVGRYRLDLVYRGEVLASQELSLYKAGSSLGAGSNSANQVAGGSRITIVQSPTVTGQTGTGQTGTGQTGTGQTTNGQTLTGQPGPGGATTPAVVPVQTPSTPVQVASTTQVGSGVPVLQPPPTLGGSAGAWNEPPSTDGLPPARQPNGMVAPRGDSLTEPPVPAGSQSSGVGESPPPEKPPGVLETYTGTLTAALSGQPEQVHGFAMNLTIDGSKISGLATVLGFEPLTVSGDVYARGIELRLQNSSFSMRLTGARRGSSLKGRCQVTIGGSSGGEWTVNRTN